MEPAIAQVHPDFDFLFIAEQAGVTDPEKILYKPKKGELHLRGVLQSDLDNVMSAYDNAARSLNNARISKTSETENAAASELSGSFASNALGASHTYKSDQQSMIMILIAATLNGPNDIECDDGTGYAMRSHNPQDIQQVLADALASFGATMSKKHANLSAIKAASNAETANAVTW